MSGLNPLFIVTRAKVALRSITKGEFTMPLESFFTSYRTTVLPADAVIIRIHVPLPKPGEREVTMTYTSKQAKRKDDDMATVVSAFRVKLNHENVVEDVSLAYGGIGPMAIEAKDAMMVLKGQKWFNPEALQEATQTLLKIFDLPLSIAGGMATYRRTLVTSLFLRFWHDVAAELDIGSVDPELTREIQRDISSGTRDNYNPNEQRVVGKQLVTLSALKQSTGEAQYVDDMPKQDGELFGAILFSERAHAKLVTVDWSPALELPGVKGYVDKTSIPPEVNAWGPLVKDEPFFADGVVRSHGQPIGMVYAETALQAHAGVKAVKVQYEDLPHILTIDEAIEQKSFFEYGRDLRKGAGLRSAMREAFKDCDRIFEGVTRMGGQEHFYLETNAAMVIPNAEDGAVEVWSSTQNAMETQIFVSEVLGVPSNRVNVRVKRMGGAFGGKESRSAPLACILAIAAKKERRPMRCMLNRDEDMIYTGQRHPIQARWKVGTTKDGKLLALEADVYDNAGYTWDMSGAVMDRALTHIDNCYEIPNVLLRGHVCKTNTHSNTAFRGFGGPQAMFITESIMTAISEGLHIPIDDLRLKNLYKQGDRTPFLQEIDQDWHVPLILSQLKTESDYENRKVSIQQFNATNKWKKRGISLIPTKFGLSFATAIHLNQGAANVKIYYDGSILLHHGGTEMGQGLYTKMSQVAAQELGVPMESIYTDDSSTYVIPNASPTAASSGSDLNGMAVKDACDQLNERLQPYRDRLGPGANMKDIAHAAYLDRVNLAASGFWKMPRVGYQWGNYDVETVQPMYYYFTQGAAVSEVELDVLTGDHTVLRTDIKMDVGRSINPAIDYGQIEGGKSGHALSK
jgi:xanthine dehydrogenase/oxidase